MTAPQADGADRISGIANNARTAGAAASGIAILLLVGLLLRLTIAYVILPGSGFETDIGTFTAWAFQLGQRGAGDFYATAGFADYPPGYLYVLWLIGGLGHTLAPLADGNAAAAIGSMIKIPPILADLGIGLVLYLIVKSWRAGHADAYRLGLLAAAMYVFNPVSIYDSAVWGQTDAVGTLVVLLTVLALIRGNAEGASALAIVAALIKPQFGVVILPIVGVVLLRRHLLRAGEMPRHPVLLPARLRGWFEYERGPWRLVSSAVTALIVLLVLLMPFSLDVPGFVRQMAGTASGYPWLSVNAYNPWSMIGSGGNDPLAFGGGWSSDTIPLLGPLPGVMIGGVILALGFGLGALRLAWRDDRRSIIVVTILLSLAFFMLPTRVHERYMYPIFAFLPLLAAINRRWLLALVLLSIAAFINFHGVLTTELYATPNLEHLPLGDLFRSPLGIVSSVVLHVIGFAYICWKLRPQAVEEPDPYAEAPLAVAPDGSEVDEVYAGDSQPWWAPLSALVPRYSVRRDRSAMLDSEPGGRLDRRDLAVFALVFVAALLLRTYRLEQPFSMHFDEVYHARTAVEFLQDWEYDEPHSIYEFTHPHLAKYAMALGIQALGNNRVTSTVDLGGPVSAATLEERWSTSAAPNARYGDRLYVATGSELRAYDLALPGPGLVASVAGPYTSVAVDPATHTLYLGQADGTIVLAQTEELDALREGAAGPAVMTVAPWTTVSGLSGELDELRVIGGQLIAVSTGGTVVSLDPETGTETGRREVGNVHAITTAPAKAEVVIDPTLVTDAAELSASLAGLLDDDPGRIEDLILNATERFPVVGYVGDLTDDIQSQIDDGNLEGVSITDGTAVAVATDGGVTLLDASTLSELATVATEVPATGLTMVEQGPEQPTLYVAAGDELVTIKLPSDQRISNGETIQMPNTVSDVYWNPATTMIHALGVTQDGSSPTVYVIEPRSNSVFADAPLAFDPRAVVVDAQPDRPAEDRDDLLALSPTGQLATVDIGNNQYAFRFPGVLLGALTAALIYLLARFLFRRRNVALIAALLVLVDGMFFANARIAMNDTYVSFFIVAAFTLFVPLWMGRWRSRWAIGGGLLAIGVLLGLALASKWVAAYAIGAVGLLILLRSALGRLIALAAMIGLTGVLGYIAITPAPETADPHLNYLFLFLMIGLTVLLAVGITVRPVRMTRDEFRLAVALPVIAGAAALIFGAYRLVAGPEVAEGALLPPTRLLIIGVVGIGVGAAIAAAGYYFGRRGRGPMADSTTVDPDHEPASPPPARGWLRPGSGLLGLPWLLALASIAVLPLAVYVISYIPWLELGNRLTETWPPGNTGQTFLDLQKSMYDYHNNLRATHPASSPWWAWLLDLKPVWFEQNDYAGSTTAVIYDTGNLIIFWLSIPAIAWASWKAWQRRSLALTFVVIAIACMWLPWARIDRAAFQYHIFTTLPFAFLAVAYFLAELWHGPSAKTWALARVTAALMIIGAPLLWLFRLPLCGIAGTEQVNSGTEVCAGLSRDFVLTDVQFVGIALAVAGLVAAGLLVYYAVRAAGGPNPLSGNRALLLPISFSVALLGVVIIVVGAGLAGNPVFESRVSAEEPAFVALLLLCVPAYFVLRSSDPRRFVIGTLAAAVAWFVAFYPNIASLPVPTPLSQIHLGLLPTWNWGFQFAVNLDEPNTAPLDWASVLMLTVAVAGLCVAAVYAARNWWAIRGQLSSDVSALPEAS